MKKTRCVRHSKKAGEPLYLMKMNPTAETIAQLIYEVSPAAKAFPSPIRDALGNAEL